MKHSWRKITKTLSHTDFLSLVLFVFQRHRALCYSLSCPETYHVAQAGLVMTFFHISLSNTEIKGVNSLTPRRIFQQTLVSHFKEDIET